MNIRIPKWIIAALVGAAPMLGLVFFVLFSCTLLGIVQRCKINLTKSYANRRKDITHDQISNEIDDPSTTMLFKPTSNSVIISPFEDIPMKDIDAESTSKTYSDMVLNSSSKHRKYQSISTSLAGSDYDNASSSIFNDNDYEQDRLSLIETSSQRNKYIARQCKTADTIIHV